MVKLKSVKESNAALKATVSGQVALFVGATSGIAGHTLTEYARYSDRPKVYIVGRNDAKLSTIIRDLEGINPGGSYIPIKSEISLLKNIDAACEELKRNEERLDLLVMCPGYVKLSKVENADGLEDTFSLRYYGRMRFIQNLLPLLLSPSSSRILNIHGAGREGQLIEDDLGLRHSWSLNKGHVHTATMNTLALGELASSHPSISFIHVFPGILVTGATQKFAEDWSLPLRLLFHLVVVPIATLFTLGLQESGERHLFHTTSARYPPAQVKKDPDHASAPAGVGLPQGVKVAQGWDQREASGCYLVNHDGETIGDQSLLEGYRKKEMGKKVWAHTLEVFDRVISKGSATSS